MEALGSPSISRAPMGGGHIFRKLVYAGNRHNERHYHSLPEIHFTATGFFLKTFDRLCVCLCFFLVLFLRVYTLWKAEKKINKNSNNLHDLQTGRTNTLLWRSFSDYHVKRATVYVLSINLHQSVPYAQNESYLAYKETGMDRNRIRSGDKIQNGGDHRFCRLTSWVAWFNPLQLEYFALFAVLLLLSARPPCQ